MISPRRDSRMPGSSRNKCTRAGRYKAGKGSHVASRTRAYRAFGRSIEIDTGLIDLQRRKRIFALPRRFEHVAAIYLLALQITGLARHPEFVLGAIVVRFDVGVGQRPINNGRIFWNGRFAIALDSLRTDAEII